MINIGVGVTMEFCDRCGVELFDFYHLEVFHSHIGDKEYTNLCPECKRKLDVFLNEEKKKITDSTFTVSMNIPDGYEVLEGENNNQS